MRFKIVQRENVIQQIVEEPSQIAFHRFHMLHVVMLVHECWKFYP